MTPTLRLTAAVISLVLVVLATARTGATPNFSDWGAPENLGPVVNSPSQDFGPATSRNGLSLFFTSDRPGGFGSFDIWVSQRALRDDPWGSPVNLGGVVNGAASDNVPTLSRDGHWLLFNSTRPDGFGGQDIWASWRRHVHDDFDWSPPFNLGPGVNTASIDVNPSLLESEKEWAPLLFFTSNRLPNLGGFDVFVSQLRPSGVFGPATLVPELSSPAQEQRPSVRFDGLEIFFHSDRPGSVGNDLWVSTRESLNDRWAVPTNLGPTVNTESSDQQPSIAADRRTLYMASDRPGGIGGLDLYVTTRSRDRQ